MAELFKSSENVEYIDTRLSEFTTFLTPEYEKLYQSYAIADKKDMKFEILRAANNFIMNLSLKGLDDMALKVTRWAESVPELEGGISYSTLKLLKATTPEDEKWLKQLVMQQSEIWLRQASKGFWSLIML